MTLMHDACPHVHQTCSTHAVYSSSPCCIHMDFLSHRRPPRIRYGKTYFWTYVDFMQWDLWDMHVQTFGAWSRYILKASDPEMKESTFFPSVMDINKMSNPSPIYCFLLQRWAHISPGNCFYGFITFFFTVCVCTFGIGGVTQKLPAEPKPQHWCINRRRLPLLRVYSCDGDVLLFTSAAAIFYDSACQLCVLTFLITRWIWIRVIEVIFEWQACANIYILSLERFYARISVNGKQNCSAVSFAKCWKYKATLVIFIICW